MKLIIAIDGPAGTGKSSVARFVAQKLNYIYVDTGAIYRALALLVERENVDASDVKKILELISKLEISIEESQFRTVIKLDGQLVIDKDLRSEAISKLSSVVSQHPEIRKELLELQRNLALKSNSGAIFEGRDIGTVVFPKAPVKIYITANSETRAKRRFLELQNSHTQATYEEILEAIKLRDLRDKSRANAPMLEAHDAVVIDTSHMSLDQVINQTLEIINQALKNSNTGERPW